MLGIDISGIGTAVPYFSKKLTMVYLRQFELLKIIFSFK